MTTVWINKIVILWLWRLFPSHCHAFPRFWSEGDRTSSERLAAGRESHWWCARSSLHVFPPKASLVRR